MPTFKYGNVSTLTLSERITTPSLHIQKDGNHWYVPLFNVNNGSVVENGDYNYTLGDLKIGDFRVAISREEANSFLIADNFYTFKNGVLSKSNSSTITKCNISEVGEYGLYHAFYGCTGLTSVSFPNLTNIGYNGLGSAFYGCTGLTGSVSFPSLTRIDQSGLNRAFYNCTGLTSVSFPSLTSIGYEGLENTFCGCKSLTGSVSFPNLTTIGYYGLQNAFKDCTNLTQIHFKSSLSGDSECTVSNMGCSNATVYFDL